MRSGCHGERLGQSLEAADYVFVKVPDQAVWNVEAAFKAALHKTRCFKTQEDLISALRQFTLKNDHIIVMSNTGFEKIYKALVPVA